MAILFHEPIFATLVESGDELFFYETGTSTDLTVYLDAGLSTPASQPVVSDAGGRFPAIYFDPSTANPKVVLNDASDVQKWTLAEYPLEDTAQIQQDLDQAELEVVDLEGRMATAESDIETLQTESTDYESRLSAIEGVDNSGNVSNSTFTDNQNIAAKGYQDLPGGLIMQWGTDSAPANGTSSTLNFPKAFPNACLSVVSNRNSSIPSSTKGNAGGVVLVSASEYQVYSDSDNAATVHWLAIGH